MFAPVARSASPANLARERKRDAAEAMYEALQCAGAWIKQWQDDKACNLAPTDSSMILALDEVETALKLAREGA